MDKDIKDRIIIGVREWAIQTAVGDRFIESNLAKTVRDGGNIEELIRVAGELEQYVLRGISEVGWNQSFPERES